MTSNNQLASPGAGLPPIELWVSRTVFGILRNTLSRHRAESWLRSETGKVLAIAGRLPAGLLQQQVLVPRPMGIEDSSRDWSPAMILQHLVIVDNGIGELITALAENQPFGREVRIAEVKPSPGAGREQLDILDTALHTYIGRVAAVDNLHTSARHAHPWFGPLDGHGWHVLAALHTMIHRRQLCAVLKHAVSAPE